MFSLTDLCSATVLRCGLHRVECSHRAVRAVRGVEPAYSRLCKRRALGISAFTDEFSGNSYTLLASYPKLALFLSDPSILRLLPQLELDQPFQVMLSMHTLDRQQTEEINERVMAAAQPHIVKIWLDHLSTVVSKWPSFRSDQCTKSRSGVRVSLELLKFGILNSTVASVDLYELLASLCGGGEAFVDMLGEVLANLSVSTSRVFTLNIRKSGGRNSALVPYAIFLESSDLAMWLHRNGATLDMNAVLIGGMSFLSWELFCMSSDLGLVDEAIDYCFSTKNVSYLAGILKLLILHGNEAGLCSMDIRLKQNRKSLYTLCVLAFSSTVYMNQRGVLEKFRSPKILHFLSELLGGTDATVDVFLISDRHQRERHVSYRKASSWSGEISTVSTSTATLEAKLRALSAIAEEQKWPAVLTFTQVELLRLVTAS